MFIDLHCDSAAEALYAAAKNPDLNPAAHLYSNSVSHLDISRLTQAHALAQFFAIFVPKAEHYASTGIQTDMEFIDRVLDIINTSVYDHYSQIRIARNADEMHRNHEQGLVSGFITLEEGRPVDGRMENIDLLYQKNIRLITLTWNYKNCFGSPNSKDPEIMNEGLTAFGKEAIQHMNELGMLIDVSHLSDGGFRDVAAISSRPFVASHSNARALCGHPRNMTDDMIRTLAGKGGVMGLNFCPAFVDEAGICTIDGLVRHARYIANVGGVDCVALGSDFDGIGGNLEINNVTMMPRLLDALQAGGFTASEVEKIAYKNAERVITDVLR